MASVSLRQTKKLYGSVEVLKGIDVEINDGEFVVLVGPSGCGKSTLLRMIAGLEDISSGEVIIGDRVVNHLPPKDRDIAMVFQSYALYPHMSVRDNMSYSLRLKGVPKPQVNAEVNAAADILGLRDLLDRQPRQLSGGQRQRVAMGRAIVRKPKVFLFDEPLSNLDAKLRVQMRAEIKALHQRLGTTVIYVTHDQVEAMTMADKIVVMRDGQVEQVGAPLDLYDYPANTFVAGFIGSPSMNFLDGKVEGGVFVTKDGLRLPFDVPDHAVAARRLGFRPEHVLPGGPLQLTVSVVEPTGAETMVMGTLGIQPACALLSDRLQLRPGAVFGFDVPPRNLFFFDASGSAL